MKVNWRKWKDEEPQNGNDDIIIKSDDKVLIILSYNFDKWIVSGCGCNPPENVLYDSSWCYVNEVIW